MAILDSLPGVEVTVIVDGKDLHEHHDLDMEEDEDTITKEFVFKGNSLWLAAEVDGQTIADPLVDLEVLLQHGSWSRVIEGVQVSDRSIRKLKFAQLETVDEHGFGLPGDIERVKTLGSIRVTVCHQNTIEATPVYYTKPVAGEGIISEKAIKGQAMTHSYSLDEETYEKEQDQAWTAEPVKGAKDPAGVFLFHYRSKASLRELMIVPRTPSPVPLRERPVDTLSEAEKAELIKQLLAETANNVRIKREVKRELEDDDDDNPRVRKKARPSSGPSTGPIHFELNDDETFTEVVVASKEKDKEIIALD